MNKLFTLLGYDQLGEKEKADYLKAVENVFLPYSKLDETGKGQRELWVNRLSVGAGVIGVLATTIAGIIAFTTGKFDMVKIPSIDFPLKHELVFSERVTAEIKREIDALKGQIAELTNIPESVQVTAKLKELDIKVSAIDNKMELISKVIMESPEKALEIPMLRRDVDVLQNQNESAIRYLERQINNLQDTIKSVIVPIIVGVFSILVSIMGIYLKGRH